MAMAKTSPPNTCPHSLEVLQDQPAAQAPCRPGYDDARRGPAPSAAATGTCTRMAREQIRWPAVVDRARQIVEGYKGGVTLRQVM